jgi:hypothetical protein
MYAGFYWTCKNPHAQHPFLCTRSTLCSFFFLAQYHPSFKIIFAQVLKNWRNRFKELKHTSTKKDCEQIKRCIEIGLTCVQIDAAKRPTSREIIESLDRWDSTIHVSNKEKSPADKADDHFWKKSDPAFDHRNEVHISKRLKINRDYFETEERKPCPKDESCTEILKQAEIRDPQLEEASVSLAMYGNCLFGRLMYLENRGN